MDISAFYLQKMAAAAMLKIQQLISWPAAEAVAMSAAGSSRVYAMPSGIMPPSTFRRMTPATVPSAKSCSFAKSSWRITWGGSTRCTRPLTRPSSRSWSHVADGVLFLRVLQAKESPWPRIWPCTWSKWMDNGGVLLVNRISVTKLILEGMSSLSTWPRMCATGVTCAIGVQRQPMLLESTNCVTRKWTL